MSCLQRRFGRERCVSADCRPALTWADKTTFHQLFNWQWGSADFARTAPPPWRASPRGSTIKRSPLSPRTSNKSTPPHRRRHSPRSDPMPVDKPIQSTAHSPGQVDAPDNSDEAAQALRAGPIGAYIVAGISVGLVFIAWLVFYFFVFMPRGSIG